MHHQRSITEQIVDWRELSSEASSSVSWTLVLFQISCPIDAAKSDCIPIWELEDVAFWPAQEMRRGWCSLDVRSSITRSNSFKSAILHNAGQFFDVLRSFSSMSFSLFHIFAWKQISLRVFQMHHINAAQQVFKMAFFLLLIHHLATYSKSAPRLLPKISERWHHILVGTQQPKNKWCTVSGSSQKETANVIHFLPFS